MYLNELDAVKNIEAIAKIHTNDFKVVLLKRKPKDLVSKYVFFALKVSIDNSEAFFDAYMEATAANKYLVLVESEVIEDNAKAKELFLIKAEIKVVKGEDL